MQVISLGRASFLEPICVSTSLPALPRSVLLHRFNGEESGHGPHLLVGLADGTLVTFIYDEAEQVLKSKTAVSLGNTAVHLTPCVIKETSSVLAYGSRAEVLYWNKQRLQHSPVLLKVSLVCYSTRSLLTVVTGHNLGCSLQ